MTLRTALRHGAALAVALVIGGATSAQAQTFFGEDLHDDEDTRLPSWPNATNARNLFMSSLEGVGTESFESFAAGTDAPLSLTFPGAGTADLTGSGEVVSQPSGTNGFGRYPTDGDNYFSINTGSTFRIDFTSPVAAFGFFGIDISDFGEELYLTFYRGGLGTDITVPNTPGSGGSTGGSVLFYGLIDALDPFDAVEFTSSSGEVFAFDEMTIGSVEQVRPPTVTPEPVSMVLLGTGLLGIGYVRRRRNRVMEHA